MEVVHDKEEKALMLITCMRGHTWTAQFVKRQGHRWCKICPVIERQEKAARAREALAEERARIAREQREVFERARQQMQEAQAQVQVEQEAHEQT